MLQKSTCGYFLAAKFEKFKYLYALSIIRDIDLKYFNLKGQNSVKLRTFGTYF